MIAAVAPEAAAPSLASPEERLIRLQQTVSPSRLTLFLQCRLKFFFRYAAQIAKPTTPALPVGSSVHAVLKAWNKARWRQQPLTLKQLHEEYVKAWADADEPVTWEAGEEEIEKQTGWRLVETYFRESKIPVSLKPDAVEVPVETDLRAHGLPVLIGVLDLVQGGRIIDFKTSSTTPNAEKVAQRAESDEDCCWVLGLRNSHDKTFPAGITAGASVSVCDNLSFSGEVKLARKHTTHITRDLPRLVQSAVGKLMDRWHHRIPASRSANSPGSRIAPCMTSSCAPPMLGCVRTS